MLLNQIPAGPGENTDEALKALAIAAFSASNPLTPFMQFYTIRGNADAPRKTDDAMTAGENRVIGGADYTAIGNEPDFGAITLKIYGGEVFTDVAHVRRGQDIGSQRAKDLENFAKSLGRRFMDAFINDALSASAMSGLSERITGLSRNTVLTGSAGAQFPTGNATAERKLQDAFFEQLDIMIAEVSPDAIICNAQLLGRFRSVGRSYITSERILNIYNQEVPVPAYNGVPLINAGNKNDNTTQIITNTETAGASSSICTSLYMVKFGEESDLTLATNVGLDVHNVGIVGSKHITMCEMDVDMEILNKMSVARLSGIRLGA